MRETIENRINLNCPLILFDVISTMPYSHRRLFHRLRNLYYLIRQQGYEVYETSACVCSHNSMLKWIWFNSNLLNGQNFTWCKLSICYGNSGTNASCSQKHLGEFRCVCSTDAHNFALSYTRLPEQFCISDDVIFQLAVRDRFTRLPVNLEDKYYGYYL